MNLTLGFSPCPNDCFVFHALVHGRVAAPTPSGAPIEWTVALDDVEALNERAGRRELDVVKVSYHAYLHLMDDYVMLRSGGALGRGVGPLVVTREPRASLAGAVVATPGGRTTANLLLTLYANDVERRPMRFDRIMPAVAGGDVDAGLIIHESRFTYPEYGLVRHVDLGEWWEGETGHVLPLGGIALRRELAHELGITVDDAIRASVEHAWRHPGDSAEYVARHAQEMDEGVRRRHIELYVNAYSRDVGTDGEAAFTELARRAAEAGVTSPSSHPAFLPRRDA